MSEPAFSLPAPIHEIGPPPVPAGDHNRINVPPLTEVTKLLPPTGTGPHSLPHLKMESHDANTHAQGQGVNHRPGQPPSMLSAVTSQMSAGTNTSLNATTTTTVTTTAVTTTNRPPGHRNTTDSAGNLSGGNPPSQSGNAATNNNAKKAASEWLVVPNPSDPIPKLSVQLKHSMVHESVVCSVKFSPDGKYMATGCDQVAQVFSVDTGECVCVLTDSKPPTSQSDEADDSYIRSVCFSPDGKYLVTGAEDCTVKLWDIAKKKVEKTFVGHDLDIYSLEYSADGKWIVSGSGDKTAKLWDVQNGTCKHTFGDATAGPTDGVTSVSISPDGKYVAAGSLDDVVRVWDATTGALVHTFEGHRDSVYSVAFSPDGRTLASGSLDGAVKVWDVAGKSGGCRKTLTGHSDFVLSVAFSSDGKWLISSSKDKSVQFWDASTYTPHVMVHGHANSVISVTTSPSGNMFATGSGDCLARVWAYTANV
eukprot:GFYU01031139.1.p1 GENE.GFYU01031139.1~~GFYU01031139.1.p1  ORF type:complete len:519 (-),score=140.25 GFYU01031139.1:141-1574(-)